MRKAPPRAHHGCKRPRSSIPTVLVVGPVQGLAQQADDDLSCGRLARKLPDGKVASRSRDVSRKHTQIVAASSYADALVAAAVVAMTPRRLRKSASTKAAQSSRRPRPDTQQTGSPDFQLSILTTLASCSFSSSGAFSSGDLVGAEIFNNLHDCLMDVFEPLIIQSAKRRVGGSAQPGAGHQDCGTYGQQHITRIHPIIHSPHRARRAHRLAYRRGTSDRASRDRHATR